MIRRRARVWLAAAVVLIPVGCGGGDEEVYSPQATAGCLVEVGAVVSRADADVVAKRARGYRVTIGGKTVDIAFGEDADDAKAILGAYEGAGGNEALYREGNAVFSWDAEPGPEWAVVEGCLRP